MANYRVPVLENFSWQPPIIAMQNDPPGSPVKGERWLVGTSPTGDWVGYAKNIATYSGTGWLFDAPEEGWMVWDNTSNHYKSYDGSSWAEYESAVKHHGSTHTDAGDDTIPLDELGATSDQTKNDATVSKHGLLPKLGGGTTNYLRADGTWATPPSGGDMYKSTYDIDEDGIVDKAEALDDGGGNNVSAVQAKEAYDRRASYDADYGCLMFTV